MDVFNNNNIKKMRKGILRKYLLEAKRKRKQRLKEIDDIPGGPVVDDWGCPCPDGSFSQECCYAPPIAGDDKGIIDPTFGAQNNDGVGFAKWRIIDIETSVSNYYYDDDGVPNGPYNGDNAPWGTQPCGDDCLDGGGGGMAVLDKTTSFDPQNSLKAKFSNLVKKRIK